jgi:L-ascorbate metabolism protein UlaG (beta-lactamase superfamily)
VHESEDDPDGDRTAARAGEPGPGGADPRGGLAVTWGGHSTVLIELDGVRLLTDPVLHSRIGPLRRIASPVATELFGDCDAVLLSHLHADHAHLRSLRALGSGQRIIAPRGTAAWLRRRGFNDVTELRPGEDATVGPLRVRATPAMHDDRRWPVRGPGAWASGASALPVGFVVRGSQSCYFAGDTDLFDDMSLLAGSIDLALLPVWGWGPALGPGHLDPARAAKAAAMIAPAMAIPIHWGTFVLARAGRRSDTARPAREFVAHTRREAPDVEVRVLEPGERMQLERGRSSGAGSAERHR